MMFATKPVMVVALLTVGVSSGLGVGWLIGKPEAVARAAAPAAAQVVAAPVAAVGAVAAVAGASQPVRGPVRVDAAVIESRDPIGALASQATGAPQRALPAGAASAPVMPGAPAASAAQLRPSEDRSVSWTTQPTRVERREPTLPPAASIASAAPVDPGVNFQRVVVMDAGSFRTGERVIRIADVSSPALDKRCTDQAGNAWPCGQRARTALESFLRNKSLTCRETPTNNQMRCEAGGVDVSQWLLENGWAMAPNGSTPALRAIEQDARRRGAGQFTPDIRAAFDMAPASSQRPRG